METPRYLTKSRFKLGLECPTKLFYTKKPQYPDKKLDDKFLASLAKGGFQVGELAKCYFPGGTNIDELDYEASLQITNELLKQENVIIYEAAFKYGDLFIRADVVVKTGKNIYLYEVKAKSFDSIKDTMTIASGLPNSVWKPYIHDIAFQKYVVVKAMPNLEIKSFLVVADKSVKATVDGLNQRFLLLNNSTSQNENVEIVGDVSLASLGQKILISICVDDIVERIYAQPVFDTSLAMNFEELIKYFERNYAEDIRIQGTIKGHCQKCEFKSSELEKEANSLDGFKECWSTVYSFRDEDFLRPSILDIWSTRKKDQFILEGKFFQNQISQEDLAPKKIS